MLIGSLHYLDPELIKDSVNYVNGTIVECNTAYVGDRSGTTLHRQDAKDHGFTKIAKVDIMVLAGSRMPFWNLWRRQAKPKMKDIGILASTDPVALDQACVDLK